MLSGSGIGAAVFDHGAARAGAAVLPIERREGSCERPPTGDISPIPCRTVVILWCTDSVSASLDDLNSVGNVSGPWLVFLISAIDGKNVVVLMKFGCYKTW